MQAVDLFRRGRQLLAARLFGAAPQHPRLTGGQRLGDMHSTELLGLPQVTVDPPQILDPGDPNFGKFVFMVGFDGLDGGAPLG